MSTLRDRILDNAIQLVIRAATHKKFRIPDDLAEKILFSEPRLRPAVNEVMATPGIGIKKLCRILAEDDPDTAGVIESTEPLPEIDPSIDALRSSIEKYDAVVTLSKCVEDLASGDFVREVMALDRIRGIHVSREASHTGTCDTTVIHPNTSEDEAKESARVEDRSKFPCSGTVFETWSVVGPGELAMLLAMPGVGKTTGLVDIGAGYLENNLGTVIHFSEEMSRAMMMEKYLLRLGNLTNMRGSLIVEAHPTSTMSIDDLARRAEALIKEYTPNQPLVAVIIDQIGLLKGDEAKGRYDQISYSTLGARKMACNFKCAIWSATQPQRNPARESRVAIPLKGVTLPVLGMGDVAECWAIPQVVDSLVSINQTEEERERDQPVVRIHAAKVRTPKQNAPSKHTAQARVRYATCDFSF